MDHRASRREPDLFALIADGLTIGRFVLGAALVPVLGSKRITLAASILGTAWLTDFFDGRAARVSTGATRLGPLDLWADTVVGVGAVLGFVAWGWVPHVLGIGLAIALVVGFAVTRNEALSMIVQATGYALVLWRLWRERVRPRARVAARDRRGGRVRHPPRRVGAIVAHVLRGRRGRHPPRPVVEVKEPAAGAGSGAGWCTVRS